MEWFYFFMFWEAFYNNLQKRYFEELELLEIGMELDEIDAELDEIGAELDAAEI